MADDLTDDDFALFEAFHVAGLAAAARGAQPTTDATRRGLAVGAGAIVFDPSTGLYGVVTDARRKTIPLETPSQ